MKTQIKQIELYSFDIFDTLITRRVGTPKGIFALMQEAIGDKIKLPKDFYTIRVESEQYAREVAPSREISFGDIYLKMQTDYSLSNEDISFLKDLEIKTELGNLVGIEENILRVKKLIDEGEKVVLISDMYHSTDTIRMFLSHISPIFDKIKIYVSSEFRASKWESKLYKVVQAEENINLKKWLHIGDNEISDIKSAKNLRIKTELFKFPQLMPYEEELLSLYPYNAHYQKIVGASRIARLNKINNKEKYDFGASFTAPILYNYINWILEESLQKGFKTLHFIARDGYIPKIVADMIIEKRGLNIKTKYIYGSRLAWRIPCEENYESFIELMMKECFGKLSLSLLAYRLHVEVEKINQYLKIKNPDSIFSDEERITLKNQIIRNKELRQVILNTNKEKIELLNDYIKQEFDLDKNIAFVDINGSGKTQDILTLYVNKLCKSTVHTFYISTSFPDENIALSKKYTYCTINKPHYHYLELLFRSLGGQTIGYEKIENKIIPVRETISDDIILNWGFESYLQGIKDFIKEILYSTKESINDVNLCYFYHDFLTIKCDNSIATILGDIPFLTIGNEKNIKKVAPELSLWKVVLLLINGRKIDELSEFPHITLMRGGVLSNFVKQSFLKTQQLPKCLIEVRLYFKLKSLKKQKLMFWGASLWLEDFIKRYKINNKNILGIIDKNPNRQGCYVGVYQIFSPNELSLYNPDYLLMTIKNHNRSIYYDVDSFISKNYPNIKLLPNIFENNFLFNLQKDERESLAVKKLSQQIFITENNLNRLVQNNISTAFLHQKTFSRFKGCHQGQELVILATGPSAEKYQPIRNAIHIGVNRAFQLNKANLDYVFIQDYSGKTPEYINELDNYNRNNCIKFYGLTCEWLKNTNRVIPESHAIKANALRYRTDWADIESFKSQFAYDISTQPLGCFGTIVFPALQFALWTYPKKIYLVGCDCDLSGYAYSKTERNYLLPDKLIQAYYEFKTFANKYYPDIEIISVNPVGLKGVFKELYYEKEL